VKDQGLNLQDREDVNLTDHLETLACTHDALRRASRQLANIYDEVVAPTGLKITQLAILGRIESLEHPHGPTLQTLAHHLSIGVSALTHALRPLIRDGSVQLQPDQVDKRIKHAVLTELGQEQLRKGVLLWEKANHCTETLLGADRALLLRDIAEQVASDDFINAYKALLNAD